jgi:hypothetical protein
MQEIHDPARSLKLPDGPFFVPRFEPEQGGQDFLGLRAVNLSMVFDALPSINNVTKRVRAFSVVAWVFWKFHQLAQASGRTTFSTADVRSFQDKAEILLTWGHQLNKVGGVPGTDSKPPAGKRVSLSFDAWKRKRGNTSLFAAVQYGPASKTENGLGFVTASDDGAWATCGPGIRLAELLDERLRETHSYALLDSLRDTHGSSEDAADLYGAWTVHKTIAEERRVFREAYFDRTAIGSPTNLGQRSETLAIAFEVLNRAGAPLDAWDIREAMVTLRTNGRAVRLDDSLRPSWCRWAVLQLRQTQRLALESLQAWIEWQLLAKSRRSTDELIEAALQEIADSSEPEVRGPTLRSASRRILSDVATIAEALIEGTRDDAVSMFRLRDQIGDLLREDSCAGAVPLALHTLLVCAQLTNLFGQDAAAVPHLKNGRVERLSLQHWANTVQRLEGQSLGQALLHMIENCVLSQHFAVAVTRFDGETQRLRISIEEEGLMPLDTQRWYPTVSPDRLDAALALAADCGLIRANDKGQYEAAHKPE